MLQWIWRAFLLDEIPSLRPWCLLEEVLVPLEKKEIGKLFGPGALSLPRLKTSALTSSSRKLPSNQVVLSLLMLEKWRFSRDGLIRSSLAYRERKKSRMWLVIPSRSSNLRPLTIKQVILFPLILAEAILWKNLVFLFPSLSHQHLDLCFHLISSSRTLRPKIIQTNCLQFCDGDLKLEWSE